MKRLLYITIIALAFVSCKVNNGDIGDFFGSWLLYDMTVDGRDAPDFNPDETFWEFQNNIIEISRVDDRLDKRGRWGSWADTGDQLLLDFTYSDDEFAPGTDLYHAPEWLYMPTNTVIALRFVERDSRHMTLDWTDAAGRRITYSLRKIW